MSGNVYPPIPSEELKNSFRWRDWLSNLRDNIARVFFTSVTATTATAGASGAPPAQVVGYLVVNIKGTLYKIPYYNT